MRRLGSQRGEGKIGCIFWIFVLVVAILVGSKVIPIKIATMQLEDHMKELSLSQRNRPQAFFEKEIYNRSRQLELEIPKDQIKVTKPSNRIVMDVRFTVPLDFVVYTYNWNIRIYLDRDVFYF